VVYQIELANSHLMPFFRNVAFVEMSDSSFLVLSEFSQKQTKLIPSGNTAVVFIGVS
jgi:hypothetical protein